MIRQAEAKDVPALSHLYHQLVRSVAPDTMIDVREDRIEQIARKSCCSATASVLRHTLSSKNRGSRQSSKKGL
jgi:hypothetical protein